jgi:uncharacterized protein (TIGR02996 family)
MASERPAPKYQVAAFVRVILNERNLTPHVGAIREVNWHGKERRHFYHLEENGKWLSKRYFDDDLEAVAMTEPLDPSALDTFIAAIVAKPDDTAQRLVFADWLTEHGQPEWGEFITAQCELERRTSGGESPEALSTLARRIEELTRGQDRFWKERLDGLTHYVWYERGLPWRASIKITNVEDGLARILDRAPIRTLRLLRFTEPVNRELLRAVAQTKALERLDGLEFDGSVLENYYLGRDQSMALFESPCCLLGIRSLTIDIARLSTQQLEFLGSRPWTRLERLDLGASVRDGTGLAALLGGVPMKRVRWIGLRGVDLGVDGARALASATHLTDLDSISVGNVGADEMAVLVAAPRTSARSRTSSFAARVSVPKAPQHSLRRRWIDSCPSRSRVAR